MHEKYRKPEDIPNPIPLFPLRGVILLPRTVLPLNVFEPRYLEMVDDAIAKGRVIGMIQPVSGEDEEGGETPQDNSAPLREVGCVGRITAFQETDDGRSMITLTGVSRFTLTEEQSGSHPYRMAHVNYANYGSDLEEGAGEDDVNREYLLDVLKRYLESHEMEADWQNILSSSSEFLVNTLSMISPYGPEEKQALLEAQDLKSRSEVLIALAEMDLASRDDGSSTTVQ